MSYKQLKMTQLDISPMEQPARSLAQIIYDYRLHKDQLQIAHAHMLPWRPDRFCPACHLESIMWQGAAGQCQNPACGNEVTYDNKNGYMSASIRGGINDESNYQNNATGGERIRD